VPDIILETLTLNDDDDQTTMTIVFLLWLPVLGADWVWCNSGEAGWGDVRYSALRPFL